jgi:hypothetical protein
MFTVRFPAWAWMWGISLVMFGGLKLLSWSSRTVTAAPGRHLAYLAGWPGMDADSFLGTGCDDRPAHREWVLGCLKLLVGVGLIAGLHPRVVDESPIVAGAIGMAGIVLVLHFGLFHLLSCLWRTFGVNAAPIMNCPVAARSLAEFWGRRWNLAFRDLSHRFLFRPLARQMPPAVALLAGFVVSGLVHDLVISVPAQGGWGGPTLYFTFQGVAILLERSIAGRRWGLGHGRRGWCFTAAVVILPSPLLFHPPFLVRVINPFLHACGA